MAFEKSSLLHRHVRREQAERRDIRKEMTRQMKEPKLVPVERELSADERILLAKDDLRNRGILEPTIPDPQAYKQDYGKIRDATIKGAADGVIACHEEIKQKLLHGDVEGAKDKGCLMDTIIGGFKGAWKQFERGPEEEKAFVETQYQKYVQDQRNYDQQLSETLERVPTFEQTHISVPWDNARHPYSPNNPVNKKPEPPQNNWGGSLYTNGNTHGGRITIRF